MSEPMKKDDPELTAFYESCIVRDIPDTDELIETVRQAFVIPIGNRIYANGMAKREALLKKLTKGRRHNDTVISWQQSKQLNSEFR